MNLNKDARKKNRSTVIWRNSQGISNKAVSPLVLLAVVGIVALISASLVYTTYGTGSKNSITTAPSKTTTTTIVPTSTKTSSTQSEKILVDIVSGAHNSVQAQNFVPSKIAVVVGVNNTVTWINNDNVAHTVTSDSGAFDSGTISPGSNFSFTFTTPGVYTYHCSIHPFMKGTIEVIASY